jgi:hypothetical protein
LVARGLVNGVGGLVEKPLWWSLWKIKAGTWAGFDFFE